MWETRRDDKPAFAYLLAWESDMQMTTCWEAFMADKEWRDIKRKTAPKSGRIVGEISDCVLRPVDFSHALVKSG